MPAARTNQAELVVVSNRGPLNFHATAEGDLMVRRGAGGLVVTVGPGAQQTGARWIAAALGDADRRAARDGLVHSDGFEVQLLAIDQADYRAYYDVVANGTLWYALHGLWDAPRRPRFDRHWHAAWKQYTAVNERFAADTAAAARPGATVLIQDYHLALVPGALRRARPDLRVVLFVHTPWATTAELAVLPDKVVSALAEGMSAAEAVGFHSRRWAGTFATWCEEVTGAAAPTFVNPASPHVSEVRAVAASAECGQALAELDRRIGVDDRGSPRQVIVRVDRIEPSKNILRGFFAFDELLARRHDLHGRVVFSACVYPSRQGLADYVAYGQEAEGLARAINERWGRDGWTPILWNAEDDYPRSVAALRRADALLVNPVRDGLNLVAKELALVNEHDAVLVLSRTAGSADELGDHALTLNPFDVSATAEALGEALDMTASERSRRAGELRRTVEARSPENWFADLVAAAGSRPSRD
jgi:trehalose 6-phosphate synthase